MQAASGHQLHQPFTGKQLLLGALTNDPRFQRTPGIISLNPFTNTQRRFTDYCKRLNLEWSTDMDYCIAMFVESTRFSTAPATRLKYSLDLTAVATRIGFKDLPLSRMYQGGLRASGALIPTEQATPITLEQLQQLQARALTQRRGTALLAALFILWKSASRWSDVSNITSKQIARITPTEIVVHWSDRTKTTRSDPHRPDSQVAIRHLPQIPPIIIDALISLTPDEPLWPHTTEWFNRWLKEALPNASITAHSFKTAALAIIARGCISNRLPISLVALVAKHKTSTPELPGTTLRYIRDSGLKADLLRTAEATALLPW